MKLVSLVVFPLLLLSACETTTPPRTASTGTTALSQNESAAAEAQNTSTQTDSSESNHLSNGKEEATLVFIGTDYGNDDADVDKDKSQKIHGYSIWIAHNAKQYPRLKYEETDYRKGEDLMRRYNVTELPAHLVFKDGTLVYQYSGFDLSTVFANVDKYTARQQ